MTRGDQRDQRLVDHLALADDGLADFVAQCGQDLGGTLDVGGIDLHGVVSSMRCQ